MNPDQSAYGMAMIAHDLCDAMDLLVANAARGTGRAKAPKPDKPSSPSGCHPISQGEVK
jgi:hypothetical protein